MSHNCADQIDLWWNEYEKPFWPNGTGIARGWLAALDTAWCIKGFANNRHCLDLIRERESVYQLLSQTSHDNLSKKYNEYGIDPKTRYNIIFY